MKDEELGSAQHARRICEHGIKMKPRGLTIFFAGIALALGAVGLIAAVLVLVLPDDLFKRHYVDELSDAELLDPVAQAQKLRESVKLPPLEQEAVNVFSDVDDEQIQRHLLNLITPADLTVDRFELVHRSARSRAELDTCYQLDRSKESKSQTYLRRDDAPLDELIEISKTLRDAGVPFSRYTGYEGERQACHYIRRQLDALGLEVIEHPFDVPTPMDHGARLVAGTSGNAVAYELLCAMPNGARTSSLPSEGIAGKLIDGGSGSLHDLKGKPIEGNIVVVDLTARTCWENVYRLGGRAVIFRGNEPANRADTLTTHILASANYPRFYIPQDAVLEPLYGRDVRLYGRMRWENREAVTLIARVPGRVPEAGAIMITAHYDSSSVIPGDAPGADQACSAAGLLELARVLRKNPPARDVLFVFFAGHYQGLAGSRTLMDDWRCDAPAYFRRLGEYQRYRKDPRFKDDPRLTTLFLLEHDANFKLFHSILKQLQAEQPIRLEHVEFAQRQLLAQQVSVVLSRIVSERIAQEDSSELLLVRQRKAEQKLSTEDPKSFLEMNRFLINPGRASLHELNLPAFMQVALQEQLNRSIEEVDKIISQLKRRRQAVQWLNDHKPALVLVLGLTSQGEHLNIQPNGFFIWGTRRNGFHPDNPFWSNLGDAPMSWAVLTEQIDRKLEKASDQRVFGTRYESRVVDGSPAGVLGYYATDAGSFNIWDFLAVNVGTTGDFRLWHNTPFDTYSRLNIENLTRQVRYLAAATWKCAQETALGTTDWDPRGSTFYHLSGHILALDQRRETVPTTPVPNAFVRIRRSARPLTGVLPAPIAMTDYRGRFEMPCTFKGLKTSKGPVRLQAYSVDEEGNIVRTLDQAQEDVYPTAIAPANEVVEVRFVTFECRASTVSDFTDPRFMVPLEELFLLASGQDISPAAWAVEPSMQFSAMRKAHLWGRPYVNGREGITVVAFTPPDIRPKFLGAMGSLGVAMRTFLLGTQQGPDVPSENEAIDATGQGFDSRVGVVPFAPAVAHRDLHAHVAKQIDLLESSNIRSERLVEMHDKSSEQMQLADAALRAMDYPAWLDHSLRGRALELRAYMDAASTKNDTILGVLFFMAILVPFALIAERLLFGLAAPVHQLLACAGIFLVSFLALRLVHPGFEVAHSTMVVLLGFVTAALSLAVIKLGFNKFDYLMRFVTVPEVAAHTMDISRAGALASACFVSIGNMRRSRIRTFLTLLTVTVMTFCVLSFTSIKTTLNPQSMEVEERADYDGIVLVTAFLRNTINQWIFRQFQDRFEPGRVIMRSNLHLGARTNYPGFRPPGPSGINQVVGIMPEDAQRSGLNKTLAKWSVNGEQKVLGRWLNPRKPWEVLLPLSSIRPNPLRPQHVPEFTPEDFIDGKTQKTHIKGVEFTVVGIFNDEAADKIHDPNGEPCSPASNMLAGHLRNVIADTEDPTAREPLRYEHVRWQTVALANYQDALSIGADIRTIIIGPDADGPDGLEEMARQITQETALDVFMGRDGRVTYWRAVPLTGPQGLGNILLPLALGSLIIFNTLLGSVQDRVSEIGIYNALGLAPPHIAGMFLAEAGVYAVLGSVLGYLTGQGVLAGLNALDLMTGLSLNYSSTSALMTMGLMMIAIMLSAIYPMQMVKRLCTAGAEASWEMPPAHERQINVELPFTVDLETAEGLSHFVEEYVSSHQEASLGTGFITDQVQRVESKDEQSMPTYHLDMVVRLAPYDMGIAQQVRLSFAHVVELEMYAIYVVVSHRSGTDWLWYRKNKEFIDTIRRQLLLWHSLDPEIRTRYGGTTPLNAQTEK